MSNTARSPVDCVVAIYVRDAQLAAVRPIGYAARAFNVLVGICGFYFLAKLVDTAHFSTLAHRQAGYFGYVSVNLAFLTLQGAALQAIAAAVRADQGGGALEPIIATARRAWPYVAASGLWPLTVAAVEVVLSLLVASRLGLDLGSTNGLTLSVFVVLSTLTMASISLLSTAVVIAFKYVPPTTYLIAGIAPLLAGVFFPVTVLPASLRLLSWCLPLTHALSGLRAAFSGASLAQCAPDAIWLLCAIIVLFPAGSVLVERAIDRGRRDGTLSLS